MEHKLAPHANYVSFHVSFFSSLLGRPSVTSKHVLYHINPILVVRPQLFGDIGWFLPEMWPAESQESIYVEASQTRSIRFSSFPRLKVAHSRLYWTGS